MRSRDPLGLLPALVGEVQARGASGEHLAGGGRLPVSDEQHRAWAAEERSHGPWSGANLSFES